MEHLKNYIQGQEKLVPDFHEQLKGVKHLLLTRHIPAPAKTKEAEEAYIEGMAEILRGAHYRGQGSDGSRFGLAARSLGSRDAE